MANSYEDVEESFWNPEKDNDSVEGVFVSHKQEVGENKQDLYTLKQSDGNLKLVWGSTVLNEKMKMVNLDDDIKIIYLGKKKGKKEYKDFKVQRAISETTEKEEAE